MITSFLMLSISYRAYGGRVLWRRARFALVVLGVLGLSVHGVRAQSGTAPALTDTTPRLDTSLSPTWPAGIDSTTVRDYLEAAEGPDLAAHGRRVACVFELLGVRVEAASTILYLRAWLQEVGSGAGGILPVAVIVEPRPVGPPILWHRVPEQKEGSLERDEEAIFPSALLSRVRSQRAGAPMWDLPGRIAVADGLHGALMARLLALSASRSAAPPTAAGYLLRPVESLLAALRSQVPDIRTQAARELGGRVREDPAAVLAGLEDEEPFVRQTAARALGEARWGDAVAALAGHLSDEGPGVAYWSARALGEIGDTSAVPLLIDVATQRRPGSSRAAIAALARLDDPRVGAALIEVARSGPPGRRRQAIEALGARREPRAVEALCQLLDAYLANGPHGDGWLPMAAADALGAIGDTSAVGPLIVTLARGQRQEARAHAARALGQIGDRRALEPLIRALRDEHPNVRSAAAIGLGDLNDPRAVPALRAATTDPIPPVRHWAEAALRRLTGQLAEPE